MSEADWTIRCVCGREEEGRGFMIQCGACEVWQHAKCVGVYAGAVPDDYQCEKCDPDSYEARMEETRRSARERAKKRGRKRKGSEREAEQRRRRAYSESEENQPKSRDEKILQHYIRLIEQQEAREKEAHEKGRDPYMPRRRKKAESEEEDVHVDSRAIKVLRQHPMSPMYLGRKAWILHCSRQQLPLHCRKNTARSRAFMVKKQIADEYEADRAKQEALERRRKRQEQ